MGKRKSSRKKSKNTAAAGYSPYHGHQNSSRTLREESSGKKKHKPVDAKLMLKLDHIKNLALWANGEASIPTLGAFFGNLSAQTVEALNVPLDPNLFSCQRCESILQPGINCTVRIEKQKHTCKKFNRDTQNNVVYHCHFCSHQNLKRGTPKNSTKELKSPSKAVVEGTVKNIEKTPKPEVLKESSKEIVSCPDTIIDEPSTPMMITRQADNKTILELRSKKRNRLKSRKTAESLAAINEAEKFSCTNITISSKKKRKSWTSLKEIAARSSQDNTRKVFSHLQGIPIQY